MFPPEDEALASNLTGWSTVPVVGAVITPVGGTAVGVAVSTISMVGCAMGTSVGVAVSTTSIVGPAIGTSVGSSVGTMTVGKTGSTGGRLGGAIGCSGAGEL